MSPTQLACLLILVGVLLVIVRALRGPTVYDRILAVNVIGTKTVMVLALLGFLQGREGFLDIAILYALVNFTGTIAILKFVEFRKLS